MSNYGQPQSFELNAAEMSILFDLLNEALGREPGTNERLEKLRWLRNELHRRID